MIGPEDLRRGDFITVTHTTYEFIADFCAPAIEREIVPTRTTMIPCEAGQPMKVVAVCLPFALVRHTNRALGTLDLRRHRVARLNKGFGRKAFSASKKRKKHRKK